MGNLGFGILTARTRTNQPVGCSSCVVVAPIYQDHCWVAAGTSFAEDAEDVVDDDVDDDDDGLTHETFFFHPYSHHQKVMWVES